jgi:hypothetical protein
MCAVVRNTTVDSQPSNKYTKYNFLSSQISDVSIELKPNLISMAISHFYIDKNRKSSLI